MGKFIELYGPLLALAVVLSAICEVIYYVLHRKEKQGKELSRTQQEWISMARVMRIGFLIIPIASLLFDSYIEKTVRIVIGLFIGGIFIRELIKGRKL